MGNQGKERCDGKEIHVKRGWAILSTGSKQGNVSFAPGDIIIHS